MTGNTEPNEPFEIVKGVLFLLGWHLPAGIAIVALGPGIGSVLGGDAGSRVWLIGFMGFWFWQLIYVLPLTILLKQQGRTGMMKGVIIGAILTALVNGACYLANVR